MNTHQIHRSPGVSVAALASALFLLAAPATLAAQSNDDRIPATPKADDQTDAVTSGGPVDREASAFGGTEGWATPTFELSNSDDQILGTFAIGYTLARSRSTPPEIGESQRVSASLFRFGLEGTVPFQGDGDGDQIDFRNIGNDAEVTVSATWFGTSYNVSPRYNVVVLQSAVQCANVALGKLLEATPTANRPAMQNSIDAFRVELRRLIDERGEANSVLQGRIEAMQGNASRHPYQELVRAIGEPCFGKSDEVLFETYGPTAFGPDGFTRAYREIYDNSDLVFAGVEASFGYETHDVLDRPAFALNQDDRIGFDGRAYAGLIAGNGRKSARVSIGYARGYDAQEEAEFCLPDPSGMGENCISGEDGRPMRTENTYVSLEGRLAFGGDVTEPPQFGIAPEVTYRIEESEFLFDLPVYLIRQKDTGLSGGVRASYDTGMDDFALRVFVGVPFSPRF